jgi:MFS family permease
MASAARSPSPLALCLAGWLSLAVAMGIGRFAFTPVLPLMMRAGQLDVPTGGWLAAANYAGYLLGALCAARMRLDAARLALLALVGTALLTAAMAWPSPVLWGVLRFLAGVCSAWVFVATSVWCLGALAQHGRSDLAPAVYAGVGSGIAMAGLYCLVAGTLQVSPAALWLQLGVLAALMALPVAWVLARVPAAALPVQAAAAETAAPPESSTGLVLCYGVMGFGYILPATFLPVLARAVVDDPLLFGLAWPVFGLTAAVSTLLAGWWMRRASRLQVWACCQALMGLGALLPGVWPGGFSIAASALLVGGTFMVITLVGVQEIRARVAHAPAAAVGRMTAAFAAGQIAGPVASALLLHVPALRAQGLALALQVAAFALFATAWWLWRQATPLHPSKEMSHAP